MLVVDASQGIQAQTLANVYLALGPTSLSYRYSTKLILPAADVPRVSARNHQFAPDAMSDIKISAKTGENVLQVLDAYRRAGAATAWRQQ